MTGRKTTFADAADDGWGGRKRATTEAELDITPMIDVTFLLLIFFMVTSTMDPEEALDVPPALHGLGVAADAAIIIVVTQGDPPGIHSPDKTLMTNDPENVGPYVEQRVQAGSREVIIKAERQVKTGFVQKVPRQVHNVISEFPDARFSIAVEDRK